MQGIEELPASLAALASEFREGAVALARATVADLIGGTIGAAATAPATVLLREANIETRFFVGKQGQRVFFFFVQRDTGSKLVLDAGIRFRISPTVFAAPPPRMLAEGILHFAVPPPFLVMQPEPDDVRAFASALRADSQEMLLLQVEDGILAVAHPESRAAIAWRAHGGTAIKTLDTPLAAQPFLSLMRAIGRWVAEGFDRGPEFPLNIDTLAFQSPAIHEIFHQLCEAWAEAYNEAAYDALAAGDPIRAFIPAYEVQDYQANILLRLKSDGSLAFDDADDPFQLQLRLSIEAHGGAPRSRICAGPPDFLVSGSIHASLLVALNGEAGFADLARALQIEDEEERLALRIFLLAAFPSALVFRVKRHVQSGGRRRDTDMAVYSGVWSGRAVVLAVTAELDVIDGPEPDFTYRSNSHAVIYSTLPAGKPVEARRELIEYGLKLLTSLRDWIGVLR